MTDVVQSIAIAKELEPKFSRTLEIYSAGKLTDVYALYAGGALTGWAGIIAKPIIGDFNGMKCVLVPIGDWLLLKNLGHDTVTPFRIIAKGRTLIAKGFMPHTGLKFAVQSHGGQPYVHIPVEDFKSV